MSAAGIEWPYSYAGKVLDDFHQLQNAAKSREIEVAADPLR